MKEIFVPTVHSFENNNIFTGSCGMLRFKLSPKLDSGMILAEVWHGLLCYEKSEVEESKEFPMTAEGREE